MQLMSVDPGWMNLQQRSGEPPTWSPRGNVARCPNALRLGNARYPRIASPPLSACGALKAPAFQVVSTAQIIGSNATFAEVPQLPHGENERNLLIYWLPDLGSNQGPAD
jgi:hypothetical protein